MRTAHPEKASMPMRSKVAEATVTVRPSQAAKTASPMEVTESGMVTEVRPLKWKARSPMEVTEAGMVTEVRPLQRAKVPSPMEVTEAGMVTEVRPLQLKKA